ncbi:hypothetical protein BH23ACT3_BH23ACT3_10700 [soil metagenome]
MSAAGANASAMVGYGVGGAFTADVERDGRLAPWRHRLRANSFESVLLMRLLFVPYDLVNYTAGFLRIRWRPFLAATAIGSLPGTASFVLLGASLTRLDDGVDGIDRTTLAISVLLIVVSRGVVESRAISAGTSISSATPWCTPRCRSGWRSRSTSAPGRATTWFVIVAVLVGITIAQRLVTASVRTLRDTVR